MYKPGSFILLASLLLTIKTASLHAQNNVYQEAATLFSSIEGLDQNLINGRILLPPRLKTYGHPYLGEDEFYAGEIGINNRKFHNLQLKYDILEQHVVIAFYDKKESLYKIILNNEFIKDFTLGEKYFKHMAIPGQGKKYYQILGGDLLSCYYYFYKRAEEKAEGRYLVRQINNTKCDKYLFIGSTFLGYKSNRSFIKKFNDENRTAIKKYMRDRKLKLKSISDKDMEALLKFCETQIDKS